MMATYCRREVTINVTALLLPFTAIAGECQFSHAA